MVQAIFVRYADDVVAGFEHEETAKRFLADLRQRMEKFALSLHPSKTRLLEFGRFAAERRAKRGLGKPETFNFLGFTHIVGRTQKGRFLLIRTTRRDRMRAKLGAIKEELRKRMHDSIPQQGEWLRQVVRGYFAYHAVPTNIRRLSAFRVLRGTALAANAAASQSEGSLLMGPTYPTRRGVATLTAHSSPVARCPLCRQSSKVRAQCPNRARWDLCGGCAAMRIPTAII